MGLTKNSTKIGEGSLIWGLILVALSIIASWLAFFLFVIPIILGLFALKQKDKLGYFGILLGVLSWIILWFVMPYIRSLITPGCS